MMIFFDYKLVKKSAIKIKTVNFGTFESVKILNSERSRNNKVSRAV